MIRSVLVLGVFVLGSGCFALRSTVEPDLEPTQPGFEVKSSTSMPAAETTRDSARVYEEPMLISEVRAPYAEAAKTNGVEGTVALKVKINERGQVVYVEVLDGPGFGLNRSAAEAMRKFHFRPASIDGTPVPFTFVYRFTFKLD